MSERPWMPMFWGDYVKDTLHLNTFQHGCYLLLIAAYWIRGGPLPNDPAYLAQVCRTTQDKIARWGKPVVAMFTTKDGWLIHKRIEKELLRWNVRSASARASAQQRARVRQKSDSETQSPSTQPETLPPQSASESSTLQQTAPPLGANGHAKPKSQVKGTRLSEDWRPTDDAIRHCRENLGASTEILNREYEAFMDWGLSACGQVAIKRDWNRAFINWIRRVMNGIREQEARERRWAEQRSSKH